MKYKKIPNTDLEVSIICLGTMNFGQQNTEADAHAQLDYAIERGINFIDTAEIYPVPPEPELQGLTETYIGTWLAKTGKRKDLIIASKVAPADFIRTRNVGDRPRLDKKSIREAVEGTLARLQTDYLDLYQIHWPERNTNFFGLRSFPNVVDKEATEIEETLSALTELVKEGKVRYIGVSNETAWGVSEYLRLSREKGLARIVSIQNQYSLTNRTFEIGLSEFAMREGVTLLPYSALSMGVLSGKYLDGAQPVGARFTITERNRSRYNPPETQEAVKRYVGIAKKYELDPSEMAIAFTLAQPFVTSTIIGATTIEQLKSDIDASEIVLSNEVMAEIEQVHKELPDPTV